MQPANTCGPRAAGPCPPSQAQAPVTVAAAPPVCHEPECRKASSSWARRARAEAWQVNRRAVPVLSQTGRQIAGDWHSTDFMRMGWSCQPEPPSQPLQRRQRPGPQQLQVSNSGKLSSMTQSHGPRQASLRDSGPGPGRWLLAEDTIRN